LQERFGNSEDAFTFEDVTVSSAQLFYLFAEGSFSQNPTSKILSSTHLSTKHVQSLLNATLAHIPT
jgi:hypothetical protein